MPKATTAQQQLDALPSAADERSFMLELPFGTGDVLIAAYAYLHRMSERGLCLPFRVPQTVTYEHHFPRAWYVTESSEADRAANADSIDPGLSDAPPPFHLAKRPPRACGSKAIVTGFTERRRLPKAATLPDDVPGADVTNARRRKGLIVGQVVTRNVETGGVDVAFLDEAGLWDATVAAPESCILSRFVPADRSGKSDVLYAHFTPTLFNIERRVSRHNEHDARLTPDVRADTLTTGNSHELTRPPMLTTAVREALHRFVWFIEALEGRAVLSMRAALKYRDGALWFLWAESMVVSSRAPVDNTHHFGSIQVRPGAAQAPETGTLAEERAKARAEAVELWDDIQAKAEHQAATVRRQMRTPLLGGDRPLSRAASTRPTSRGQWPSFCKITVPPPEVVAAAERRFLQLTAQGGRPRPGSGVRQPAALRSRTSVVETPQIGRVASPVVSDGDVSGGSMGAAAVPLTLMEPAELDHFWSEFDAEAERCVAIARMESASEARSRSELPPDAADPRRHSVASSQGSILSSINRSVVRRDPRKESEAQRRVRREMRMARDVGYSVSQLSEDFGTRPEAAWGYRDVSPARGRRRPRDSLPSDSSLADIGSPRRRAANGSSRGAVARTGVAAELEPMAGALAAVTYAAYDGILSSPRDPAERILAESRVDRDETQEECPWRTVELPPEGPSWGDVFDADALRAHRCHIHPQDARVLVSEARETSDCVRAFVGLGRLLEARGPHNAPRP